MNPFAIAGITIGILILLVLIVAFICFRLTFYMKDKDKKSTEEFPIPVGKIYEPWRDVMVKWMKETRALNHQVFTIKTFDGLTLCAKYYEQTPGAPIELMFHGYRGYAERDLCGGVQRCFALGHNAFIVDQRAGGDSEGNVITFGIKEHKDCLCWVDFMVEHFGPNVRILLTGISMGASTVLNAAGCPLPSNVVGVLADCGFTSPADIIKKVIKDLKLPPAIVFPFIQLGARLYGHFSINEVSSVELIKNCTLPVIFFHGDDDAFVPWEMSKRNYDACQSRKKLVTIPGAGHGLCFPVAPERYIQEMCEFFYPPIISS